MTIFQPPQSGTAVAKCATVYGLNPGVMMARRARYCFSLLILREAEPHDPQEYVEFDETYGCDTIRVLDNLVFAELEVPSDAVVTKEYEPHEDADCIVIDVFATKQIFRFVKEHPPNTVPELQITLKIPQGTSDRRIQVSMEFGKTHISVTACLVANAAVKFEARIKSSRFVV